MTITFRLATPADMNFVKASWFASYRHQRDFEREDFDIYKVGMNARMEKVLQRADVRVAFMKNVPDEVLGYSVVDPTSHALFWVYVKEDYRRNKIAKHLLQDGFVTYASNPRKFWCKQWLHRAGGVFDPSLLGVP